jgi:hypothetical protein
MTTGSNIKSVLVLSFVLIAFAVTPAKVLAANAPSTPGLTLHADTAENKNANVLASSNFEWVFDWETGITGNGLWHWIQVADPNRITRVTTPAARTGLYSGRIELRAGDVANGERSMVMLPSFSDGTLWYENESSGTQYYAFSVQIPAGWQSPAGTDPWGIFLQLHGPDVYGASPPFAFTALGQYYIESCAGDLDTPHWDRFPLSKGTFNYGNWTDFVVKIVYSKTASGSIQVWRRDVGDAGFTSVLNINHATLQWASSVNGGAVGDHYWTYGFYRNPQTSITNILYLDTFARAQTFDRAVQLAFGTSVPTNTPIPGVSPTPTSTPIPKPGDLNGDGKVDIFDYNAMVADFGKTGSPGWIPADINKDGKVDIFDYNVLVGNFGK